MSIYGVLGLLAAGIGINRWRGVGILYFIEEWCVVMIGVLAGNSHNFFFLSFFFFLAARGFLVLSLLSRHIISYGLEYCIIVLFLLINYE